MKTQLTFLFAAVMFAAGCSSSAEPTPIPTAPGPTTSPSSPGKEDEKPAPPSAKPTTCGAAEQVASTATLFFDSKPEPAAKGGALEDGVYVLEKVTRFAVESPDEPRPYAERTTLRYVDGVADFVVNDGDAPARRSSSEVTLNGASLTAKDTCPGTRTSTLKYTATGNALDLYVTSAGMKFVQHFVRFSGP
jgi:hypothetical protein